jgi:cyclopropane fatty-acyl-phospholipid synthase-like methyltransferase
MTTHPPDQSNGYEEYAEVFMRARNNQIGPSSVLEWSRSLAPGSSVLELGCGHGVISQAVIDAGFSLHVVDASPKMIRAFQARFPTVPAECAAIEDSDFFRRTFDGIVAWGLMFLLPPDSQKLLIAKAAKALNPGGQFLFTSVQSAVRWNDSITECESVSLGQETYDSLLKAQGLTVHDHFTDIGENYYYVASRT